MSAATIDRALRDFRHQAGTATRRRSDPLVSRPQPANWSIALKEQAMGAECVGEFTVYKKGWLATLHRNPVKNLILFSYLPTQSGSTNLP